MRYLTASDVAGFNEDEVGEDLLADFGLLESAVLRPQTSVGGQDAYRDIHEKAAALMQSLIRNHAFVDGNKRTASLAVVVFYGLNGYEFIAEDGDLVALALDIAEGLISLDQIAAMLKNFVSAIFDEDDHPDGPS